MSLKSSTKTDVNTTELVISIDADAFEAAVEKEYQRQKKNIQIKGFRKGKVTRKLAEKEFGEGAFYEGAINSLLGPEIDAAVKETGIVLVDRPNVEVTSIDKAQGVELKAVCVTKPEIEITDYKGIKAPKEVKEITDADIDNQIDVIRKKNARIVSVDDRAAQLNDEVIIDFEGFFGDEAFEGGKGEDHPLKLGSGQFIPGFEDQIVGHNIGDEFDVTVTFPENYQMSDYAGKEAVFKCKLKAISYEELPEINDDLIKDATEFDTVDEYRADIKSKLEEAAVQPADSAFENAVMNALIEKVDAPIPNCMFEQRIDALMRSFEQQLRQQGMDLKLYFQYTGMTADKIVEEMKPEAVKRIQTRLVLEAVAKAEDIQVSDEEFDAELQKMADMYKMELSQIKEFMGEFEGKQIRSDIAIQKAVDLIVNSTVEK